MPLRLLSLSLRVPLHDVGADDERSSNTTFSPPQIGWLINRAAIRVRPRTVTNLTMAMKPLYAGLITAAAIVGAILICVGCRRCYRTRDYDDGKARRYIPGITDEENALVDERYYHDRTSGQEGKEF